MQSERVARFILICNGHAGTLAFRAKLVHTRVVCSNTLSTALSEQSGTFYARHTSGVTDRSREARDLLAISFRHTEEFADMAEELIQTEISDSAFERFLEDLLPVARDADLEQRAVKNRLDMRAGIRSIARTREDLEPVRGTAWAALQSVVEYADWNTRVVGDGTVAAERRFKRNVLNEDALKSRAVALLAPGHASASQRRLASVS
jgi:phage/plasmid-like protein (TIGR03299 family)